MKYAEGKIPTPRGPILVSWKNANTFKLPLTLPRGVAGRVELPAKADSKGVFTAGKQVAAQCVGNYWRLDEDCSGDVSLEVK